MTSSSTARSLPILEAVSRLAGSHVLTIAGRRHSTHAATTNSTAMDAIATSLNSCSRSGSSTLNRSAIAPAAIIAATDSV